MHRRPRIRLAELEASKINAVLERKYVMTCNRYDKMLEKKNKKYQKALENCVADTFDLLTEAETCERENYERSVIQSEEVNSKTDKSKTSQMTRADSRASAKQGQGSMTHASQLIENRIAGTLQRHKSILQSEQKSSKKVDVVQDFQSKLPKNVINSGMSSKGNSQPKNGKTVLELGTTALAMRPVTAPSRLNKFDTATRIYSQQRFKSASVSHTRNPVDGGSIQTEDSEYVGPATFKKEEFLDEYFNKYRWAFRRPESTENTTKREKGRASSSKLNPLHRNAMVAQTDRNIRVARRHVRKSACLRDKIFMETAAAVESLDIRLCDSDD